MLLLDSLSIFYFELIFFRSVIYVLFSKAHTTCSLKAAWYKVISLNNISIYYTSTNRRILPLYIFYKCSFNFKRQFFRASSMLLFSENTHTHTHNMQPKKAARYKVISDVYGFCIARCCIRSRNPWLECSNLVICIFHLWFFFNFWNTFYHFKIQ